MPTAHTPSSSRWCRSSRQRPLVLGAGGQLGQALRAAFPDADFRTREELDITDPAALEKVDWRSVSVVVNAAAYTAVDAAESPEGRKLAWQINVDALTRAGLPRTQARVRAGARQLRLRVRRHS